VIGVIDHHALQVERPDQVAALVREVLKHISLERLVISSDCGMGRGGMSRRHATYKMVAMVLGTNIVRKELGLTRSGMPGRRSPLFAGNNSLGQRIAAVIAAPRSLVPALPPRSGVRVPPSASTSAIARSTAAAAALSPK
jgi:hypothetical protein